MTRAALALSESLDFETTSKKVLEILIPTLGDFGFLDVVAGGETVRRIARAHEDRRRQELLDRTSWTRSTRTDLCALSSGQAALHRAIDGPWLENVAITAEHLELLRALAFRSMLTVPLVVNKRVLGALTLFRSEASHAFAEEDLRLAQEVAAPAAMAIENARLYRAAQEAARRKDEFLAMLGHELRNPLAPIVTALELLRVRSGGSLGREFDIIERQIAHLQRLVDDLLDVSRITRGKLELHPKPVELATVVADAVEQASPLLERHRHRLIQSVPTHGLRVRADPHRMAQVLANLLTNAAKYTPEGGTISLGAARDGPEIVIAIEDNGIGIQPELLPVMFDPFSQGAQEIDRAQGGLGLGLAIVKSLVELHDGKVEARSAGVGRGSRFTLRLPRLVTGLEIPAALEDDAAAPATPLRILVVDDNRDAARTLQDLLELQGHEVKLAVDGPSALRIAPAFAPEVALLDIGLPVMDGYELASQLRRRLDPPPRLVAISGYGLERDHRRSKDAGFERHLVKPVSIAELRTAIEGRPEHAVGPSSSDRP